VGELFLGRYQVWKSSGTTASPGIFLQDENAMSVYDALLAAQYEMLADPRVLMAAGARGAIVAATGDHFAGITMWEHMRRAWPGGERASFSILEPLPKLVAGLNAWDPAFLAGYPSILELLAAEREAGRLRISPVLAWSGGEHLSPAARRAIERAFGCRVMNEYGASECMSMACACREDWLHVNREWVIVEPVDAHGRATPPGVLSHSVLVTNLANFVQPVIRYDLGDRVLVRDGACPCGNPAPAIRVEGRTDDVLALRSEDGSVVRLPPLALATVAEEAVGEHRFQIAQAAPDRLLVRLEHHAAWKALAPALRDYLGSQGAGNVRVALDRCPPRIDPRSGKLRAIVVEDPACRTG
jgi:phenylacetate-coenzyme A ligase PaaK-like adenylate-forming protein